MVACMGLVCCTGPRIRLSNSNICKILFSIILQNTVRYSIPDYSGPRALHHRVISYLQILTSNNYGSLVQAYSN